jgi:ABC-2 type transport system ATP-binding protein
MDTAIEVKNLTKTYGNLKVVDNLNISVKSGEIFGLLRCKWSWKNNNH